MFKALVQALVRRGTIVSAMLLLAASPVQAAGLDLALSNTTANLSFIMNPAFGHSRGSFDSINGAELALGAFIDEDGVLLGHAVMMAGGLRRPGAGQYDLAAGMKLIGGDIDADSISTIGGEDEVKVGAFALGLRGSFLVVPSRYNPVDLSVEAFLAPKITSFSEATRYFETALRLEVEIIPSAKAYIGYRRMQFDTEDYGRLRVDRSTHLGVKLSF